jgi:hypothetical protein
VLLTLIGYWRNDANPHLPDPSTMIDDEWDAEERDAVAYYFDRGTVARAFMGRSRCRICGKDNGSLEYTDGRFLWPDGFAHYVQDHNVFPPAEVVSWAISQLAAIEEASIDTDWWPDAIASS